MTAFGILAGMLQLVVPSYALRLVRRFGAQRVGWFVVASFFGLALLNITAPLHPRLGFAPEIAVNSVLIAGSILLLIGMGHLETICTVREQTAQSATLFREQSQTEFFQKTSGIQNTNEQLSRELDHMRERAEALAASAAQYHALFAANPLPMCIITPGTGEIISINNAALDCFSLNAAQAEGLAIGNLLAPDHAESLRTLLPEASAERRKLTAWFQRSCGERILMEMISSELLDSGRPVRVVTFNDVTERERLQQELLKNHRMATVIRMSGALGARFGHLLSIIEESTSLIAVQSSDTEAAATVQSISAAASRGSALARQLLAAGSQHTLQTEVLDLNLLLRNMTPLLSRLVGERIILQQAYGSFAAPVLADPRLIEHVVANLVLNSRNAIKEHGTITLSTTTVRVEQKAGQPARPGNFTALAVRDTGAGISPEIQAHLFEPFSSGSDWEKSMGLGLAAVYGIVAQHSGWVEFESVPGKGTEFRIFLPCAQRHELLASEPQEEIEPGSLGTVLLVEPDDRNRATARCALNWAGYRVIEADSSSLGLLLWESQSAGIDLLLTDANLSDGISGVALANRLQESKPELRVVFTADAICGETSIRADNWKILTKPFTRDQLLEAVTESFS